MKMLGLNPSDQELLDIPNKISRRGLIYYPDFCQLCLELFRQEAAEEEDFRRNMFKVPLPDCGLHEKLQSNSVMFQILCGTDPLPTDYRAKKYKMEKHRIKKVDI